ncbi:MAG: hypothetical protein QF622_10065 [Candidatus Marinimicrobia bacterium]|nr:hypothetical protein [Candidatus Neomarinimicrobiota bacterium]
MTVITVFTSSILMILKNSGSNKSTCATYGHALIAGSQFCAQCGKEN